MFGAFVKRTFLEFVDSLLSAFVYSMLSACEAFVDSLFCAFVIHMHCAFVDSILFACEAFVDSMFFDFVYSMLCAWKAFVDGMLGHIGRDVEENMAGGSFFPQSLLFVSCFCLFFIWI